MGVFVSWREPGRQPERAWRIVFFLAKRKKEKHNDKGQEDEWDLIRSGLGMQDDN